MTAHPGARRFPAGLATWLGALLLALLLASALAACGGDSVEDAEAEIEEVVMAYGEPGAEACDLLSASALDQIGGESGCTRVFEEAPAAELRTQDILVDGNTATARVENVTEGGAFTLEFIQEDGEWKISVFPGLGDFAPAPPPPSGTPEDELAPPPEPDGQQSPGDGELAPPEGEEPEPPEDGASVPEEPSQP